MRKRNTVGFLYHTLCSHSHFNGIQPSLDKSSLAQHIPAPSRFNPHQSGNMYSCKLSKTPPLLDVPLGDQWMLNNEEFIRASCWSYCIQSWLKEMLPEKQFSKWKARKLYNLVENDCFKLLVPPHGAAARLLASRSPLQWKRWAKLNKAMIFFYLV